MRSDERDLFFAEAVHKTQSHGDFTIFVTDPLVAPGEHLVLVRGEVRSAHNVLCRVASACVTSTALDSAECDCVEQLQTALEMIAAADRGVLVYLSQEGRGHGLGIKIKALAKKNEGLDTLEAVEALGLPADLRDYLLRSQEDRRCPRGSVR